MPRDKIWFDKFFYGQIFDVAHGILKDMPLWLPTANGMWAGIDWNKEELIWAVLKKGGGYDWAMYLGPTEWSNELICSQGLKAHEKELVLWFFPDFEEELFKYQRP